jgi:hypothetical protein
MEFEELEIINHAVIGGLIAVALVGFHEFADYLSERRLANHPWLLLSTLGLIVFVSVFAAIILVEFYLRKRTWKAKIRLKDLGCVDGRWIDVIVQEGQIKAASVFTIRSAAGEGFQVEGKSYDVSSAGIERKPSGEWKTIHGRLFGTDGIAYVYAGRPAIDDPGPEHFGVGFYQFRRVSYDPKLRFTGGFLAKQENVAFHAVGKELPLGASEDEVFDILYGFLRSPEVATFVSAHRHASQSRQSA